MIGLRHGTDRPDAQGLTRIGTAVPTPASSARREASGVVVRTLLTIPSNFLGGTMEGLTPGRIVHVGFRQYGHHAAIITRVIDAESGFCELTVFPPGRSAYPLEAFYDADTEKSGCWHWIERA